MLFKIEDSTDLNILYINPHNIAYIKERPNHGLWKISLVGGEIVMTKNKKQVKTLLTFLGQASL